MTGLVRRIADVVAAWRPLAPFAALFVLLMLFAVGGMLVIAHEADRSDASRAREAVARTFSAMLVRLDAAVEMNAAAPPIAGALSGPRATPASAYGYLNFTSSGAFGYYGVVVLNNDGTAFAGTRLGLAWTGPGLADAARLVAPIARRLPRFGPGTAHALLRDRRGVALAIAVANIASTAGEASAEPPRRLAMIVPVDGQITPKMLPSLGVEQFRVVAASAGDNAVTIPVEHAAPIVFEWRPRTPGRAAIARWAPEMGTLLLAALLLLVHAGRANLAARRSLERLVHRDYLTGLANRSALNDELARRQARGEMVAFGMIDLDGFKQINDEYGHPVGDALLQAVAMELSRSARPGDLVARFGGDEFAWISPSHASAKRLSEDFVERIARPLAVGQTHLRIGATIGIALADPGMNASALMATADARLYENKHASRRFRHRRATLAYTPSRRSYAAPAPPPAEQDATALSSAI